MLDAIYEPLMGAGGLFKNIYSAAMIRLIIHIEKMKTPVCNDENTAKLSYMQYRSASLAFQVFGMDDLAHGFAVYFAFHP